MRKPRPPSKRDADRAPLDADAARGRALKLLSRREHSAAELAFKLRQRGADEAVADVAVARMREAGWQSDERYAEMLVRNRVAQGYGPLRIRADLAAAGIPEAEARAALAAAQADWSELCATLRERRFRAPPRTAAEWQKQYRYLASHGFAADAIRGALKRFTAAPAEDGWEAPEEPL